MMYLCQRLLVLNVVCGFVVANDLECLHSTPVIDDVAVSMA